MCAFCGNGVCTYYCESAFSILGQKNWEQTLERELLQEDVLQSGQLDFSYMERQQQAYYEVQTKDAVAQMIEKLGR